MSDEITPTIAPDMAEHLANASPETVAMAKDIWAKYFPDKELPTVAPGTGTTTFVTNGSLTAAEEDSGYAQAYKFASTDEQKAAVVAAAKAAGRTLTNPDGSVITAPNMPEGAYHYSFSYHGFDRDVMSRMADNPDTFNTAVVNGYTQADIPPKLAQSSLEAFVKSAEVFKNIDDPAVMAAEVEKNAKLVLGLSNSAEIRRQAALAEDHLRASAPQLWEWLHLNQGFYSAQAVVMLAQIGSYLEREKRTPSPRKVRVEAQKQAQIDKIMREIREIQAR
jgi:hypothetical protein